MLHSFWDSEAAEGAPRDERLQPEERPQSTETDPAALALSADEFSGLEDRILRAVELVKKERAARVAAEERTAQAEAELREQAPKAERLEKELSALRAEHNHVRERVERLLAQLDALEL
ncbi:MAG: hypothetical protein ABR956_11910 [Terracidiphilus sp.]|jgi:FtsZ-binding cell division protein ZapB